MSYTVQRSTRTAEPKYVLQHVLQRDRQLIFSSGVHTRRASGTDGCRHQSLEAEASALPIDRRKGTLFGGSPERKVLMAVSLSYQGPAGEGGARPLPGPESQSCSR